MDSQVGQEIRNVEIGGSLFWGDILFTRCLAIIPAMAAAFLSGESGMNDLIVLSQVVLSLQLPFAIWPLVWITCGASDGEGMKVRFERGCVEEEAAVVGEQVVDYRNSPFLKAVAVAIAVLITVFNFILLYKMFYP
ncbi:hypothetical protein HDU98_004611, partial [Podochytrium sp. JEL0797]